MSDLPLTLLGGLTVGTLVQISLMAWPKVSFRELGRFIGLTIAIWLLAIIFLEIDQETRDLGFVEKWLTLLLILAAGAGLWFKQAILPAVSGIHILGVTMISIYLFFRLFTGLTGLTLILNNYWLLLLYWLVPLVLLAISFGLPWILASYWRLRACLAFGLSFALTGFCIGLIFTFGPGRTFLFWLLLGFASAVIGVFLKKLPAGWQIFLYIWYLIMTIAVFVLSAILAPRQSLADAWQSAGSLDIFGGIILGMAATYLLVYGANLATIFIFPSDDTPWQQVVAGWHERTQFLASKYQPYQGSWWLMAVVPIAISGVLLANDRILFLEPILLANSLVILLGHWPERSKPPL